MYTYVYTRIHAYIYTYICIYINFFVCFKCSHAASAPLKRLSTRAASFSFGVRNGERNSSSSSSPSPPVPPAASSLFDAA